MQLDCQPLALLLDFTRAPTEAAIPKHPKTFLQALGYVADIQQ